MALEDKISRYGSGAGVNTSTISGRLETLAKEVKNLVHIQGKLEGTARDVENLTKKSKKPFKLFKQVDADVENIKNQLEDVLGLKVNILNKKNNSGKIVIKYKSLDQFELISKKLRK